MTHKSTHFLHDVFGKYYFNRKKGYYRGVGHETTNGTTYNTKLTKTDCSSVLSTTLFLTICSRGSVVWVHIHTYFHQGKTGGAPPRTAIHPVKPKERTTFLREQTVNVDL